MQRSFEFPVSSFESETLKLETRNLKLLLLPIAQYSAFAESNSQRDH